MGSAQAGLGTVRGGEGRANPTEEPVGRRKIWTGYLQKSASFKNKVGGDYGP
jgi:hypothetical protein